MRFVVLGVVGAFVLSSATGCHTVFGFDKSVILPVSGISAPASIAAGTPLSVELTVQSGGCRRFDRIETERSGSSARITAWGRDSGGPNTLCTTDVRFDRVPVRFDPPFGSTFVITINQVQLAPLSVTVRVE